MNYIVSGLERSGTSLMMQILEKAGFDVGYDNSRKPDKNNPKGYYELYGGKIINNINNVDFNKYIDKAIKITSVGITNLPKDGRKYKVIYMQRPIDEVLDSTDKFTDNYNVVDSSLKKALITLNDSIEKYMNIRKDIDYIFIYHRNLMNEPEIELKRLSNFLNFDISSGIDAIDKKLWRHRNEEYKSLK